MRRLLGWGGALAVLLALAGCEGVHMSKGGVTPDDPHADHFTLFGDDDD